MTSTPRIGHRISTIASAVRLHPGLTAHALARYVYGSRRPAWNYVYAAVRRTRDAGLIEAVPAGPKGRFIGYVPGA